MFKDHFRSSLFKLTAVYVAIIVMILLLSSSFIYSAFSNQLQHRYQNIHPVPSQIRAIIPEFEEPPKVEDVRRDLIYSLILVNGALLVLAGIMSYWLAKWSLEPLKVAYQKQKRFLGDASHELRTPLTILKTDIENDLSNPTISKNEKQNRTSNLEEIDRMSKLVSDLLIISRLDEDRPIYRKFEKIQLRTFLEGIIYRLQPLAKEHNVSLTLYKSENDLSIYSDTDLLSQAVINLIKNSIFYNKPGGKVEVKIHDFKGFTDIAITDTGVGVSKEDLDKIFDRFYRAEPSRSRKTGGSGLGLSIVKSSVEYLGGKINIESQLGKGTTVTLSFKR